METLNYQCLLGIQCKDFAIIAADQTTSNGVIILKNDENKIYPVSERVLMGMVGDSASAGQFAQFISKNIQLYRMKNKYGLTAAATVHFARKNLADMFRNRNASMLNMLVAGYDEELDGQLYTLDITASCVRVPYAGNGFGGMLSSGILHRYHSYSLTPMEAHEILKVCVYEIHRRLFNNLDSFQVKMVSRDGIREMPTINTSSFAKV